MDAMLAGVADQGMKVLPGARSTMEMEKFRRLLESKPKEISAEIRQNAERHRMTSPMNPSHSGKSMVEWLSHEVAFADSRSFCHAAYGIAHMVDLMFMGKYDQAEALGLLLCACFEQVGLNHGRWSLGWLLTHLSEPPSEAVSRKAPKEQIRPYARLANPTWIAACVGYMNDAKMAAKLQESK